LFKEEEQTMKKHLGLLISLIMIVTVLAAQCPPPSPTAVPGKPTTVPATTAPGKPTSTPEPPAKPVTLRMAIVSEPPTLDPNLAEDTTSIDADKQLFQGLLKINGKTSELEKDLATDWKVTEDGTVYTFTMRKDAYWVRYDPATEKIEKVRPITAQDIEYSVQRAVMPETASPYSYVAYAIKNAEAINNSDPGGYDISTLGVKALDDYTIQFTLEFAASYFPSICSLWTVRPVPKEAIEKYGEQWTEPGNIMTNGPMVLAEWTHDAHLTYKKNPYYYDADKIQIEEIDVSIVTDSATILAMYENDELDMSGVPTDDLDRVRQDPVLGKEFYSAPYPGTYILYFRTTKPPMDNVHVRRALSYAIDRQSLIDNVIKGGQMPARAFAPPGIFGNVAEDPEVGITFDLAKAKAELTEAGYPDGQGFPTILYMYNTAGGFNEKLAQAVAQMWKDNLNIDVTFESMEWKVYLGVIKASAPDENVGHTFRYAWLADYPDQNNWVHEVHSPTQGANRSKLDPEKDPLAKELDELTIAAGKETDLEKRKQMYKRAEQILTYEICAFAPLYHYTTNVVVKPYLHRDYPLMCGINWAEWTIDPH
jgi:oligopeptide transport system substrate-binding protein